MQAPNLVFLAVTPEEKESWVNALNIAIIKAKNHILDEVRLGGLFFDIYVLMKWMKNAHLMDGLWVVLFFYGDLTMV